MITMVTDEQYRLLSERVTELENKLNLLSRKYSEMIMRNSVASYKIDNTGERKNKHRDKTKYLFEGKVLSKRELVYNCVKSYVSNANDATIDALKRKFPDYVQGPLGIVVKASDAERYADCNKRFWFDDERVLFLENIPCVVCKQWSINNIDRFINLANDLGFEISKIEMKY